MLTEEHLQCLVFSEEGLSCSAMFLSLFGKTSLELDYFYFMLVLYSSVESVKKAEVTEEFVCCDCLMITDPSVLLIEYY